MPVTRWFSRVVVEGYSLSSAGAFGQDEEDPDASSDESSIDEGEEGSGVGARGQTFFLGKGTIKLLENGMGQYVGMVERKLSKRQKAERQGVREAVG